MNIKTKAMEVIITGMRRSGTTILYDLLYEDQRFDAYYEPFTFGKKDKGGGSGLRKVSFMDKLNQKREEFLKKYDPSRPPEIFNLGAPSDFRYELDREIPDIHKQYLQYMAAEKTHTLFKFVRLFNKLPEMHEIFPDARVIHIFKDPRRIAFSHVIGSKEPKDKFMKLKHRIKKRYQKAFFFQVKKEFNFWSAENMINTIIEEWQGYRSFEDSPAFEKVMLLWKILNDQILKDGKAYYGDKFMSIKHEELCTYPAETLQRIYDFAGLDLPDKVRSFSTNSLKPPRRIFKRNNKKWSMAAQRTGIDLSEWEQY